MKINDLLDIQTLVESEEIEFKLAAGKDGKGALPKDFWPTYSAMSNSHGGSVILGVKELSGKFIAVGINDQEKIKSDLFNQLNDRDRVSANVLKSEQDVQSVTIDGATVLAIYIPAASRKQKPVHLKKTPFGNTYVRLYDGDRICDDMTVKKMLAEQLHDSRDNQILSRHYHFSEDIDLESLTAYRNLLSAYNHQHPYLTYDLFELFKKTGSWRKDRESGEEGITLAGILMFGKWDALISAVPNYFVDYQERPEAKTELRWIDRICPDGTWSGNLFDFYRRVYKKLTEDLKIPFALYGGQRKLDTPVHIALREALVNSLVHADFFDRASVLIVKRPDMFGFRNPGLMRIPIEDVIAGGVTDCRNRLLHQMFLLIGLGERAGTGMPKIFSGWKSANWRTPKLWEKQIPSQTILELPTASLIPDRIVGELLALFGERFNLLDDLEQIIIATAASEGWVNHERACQLTTRHSREVTLALQKLERKDFLVANGEQRQKTYTIQGVSLPTPDEIFSAPLPVSMLSKSSNSTYMTDDSTHKSQDSFTHKTSVQSSWTMPSRDKHGRLLNEHVNAPYIDSVDKLSDNLKEVLYLLALESRRKNKIKSLLMREIILNVCTGHYISVSALAEILDRNPNAIRQQYLKSMVDAGELELAFPQFKNSPKQGYRTWKSPAIKKDEGNDD
ncbi:RNA-binding domain-containing protein [Erwinia mallotivora]|uniref:RNA-binding domain-containing protein n=1 Tax=Erwinia mallotivora TaxID=69222 RepID=UPI0021C15723|nr:RNA-binding domain-containing protein [Erwinia mallotivora]